MAHSDTLIFLTNVTWTFFLFIGIYLFFVLFFIPSFFKKVRLFSISRVNWVLDGFYALISIPAALSHILYIFKEVVVVLRNLVGLLFSALATTSFLTELKLNGFNSITAVVVGFLLHSSSSVLSALIRAEVSNGVYFSKFF